MPNDEFGLTQIYPSLTGGESYTMPADIDKRKTKFEDGSGYYDKGRVRIGGHGGDIQKEDGTFFSLSQNDQVRISFGTSAQYDAGEIETNREQIIERGYMMSPKDWKNIEFTCEVEYEGGAPNDEEFTMYSRGGVHTDSRRCEGFAYKAFVEYDGKRCGLAKEDYHPNYAFRYKDVGVGSWNGKVRQIKYVVYNLDTDGKPTLSVDDGRLVKLELWFSKDGNGKFTKIFETTDKGGWNNGGGACGGDDATIGVWGGPLATIRWDEGAKIKFGKLTIREIDPTKNFDNLPPGSDTPPPVSGGGAPATVDRKLFMINISANNNTSVNAWTRILTEECVETQTDPNVRGEFGYKKAYKDYSTLNEIGDICDGTGTSVYPDGLGVKKYWSNSDNNCVAPGLDEVDLGNSTLVTNQDGGPVMKTPKLYLIFWGSEWTSNSTLNATHCIDHIRNKLLGTDSIFFSKLSQYGGCGVPLYGGEYYNTTTGIPIGDMTRSDIIKALTDMFELNKIPIPTSDDSNNVYCIFSPQLKKLVSQDNPGTYAGGFHMPIKPTLKIPSGTPPVGGNPPGAFEPNDKLGVRMIYESKPNGTVWMPDADKVVGDDRFDDNGAGMKHLGNGVYEFKAGTTRMLSYTTKEGKVKGEGMTFVTHDFKQLRINGSWKDPVTDFHNIEMTSYMQHMSQQNADNDEFSFVARSVRHDETVNGGCGGSSYHGNIHLSGFPRFKKEQYHVNYVTDPLGNIGIGNIKSNNRTFGMKFVCFDHNKDSVKLEVWLDKNNDNKWERYVERTDNNNWGDDMTKCGAVSNGMAIVWGSHKVIWKTNNQVWRMSKMSVREIIPGEMHVPGVGQPTEPEPPATGGGGSGQVSRIMNSWDIIYDNIVDRSGFTCSGAGAPGGGAYTTLSDIPTITDDKTLCGTQPTESDRTRVAAYVGNTNSDYYLKKITKVGLYLKKIGNPPGKFQVQVWDNSTGGTAGEGAVKTTYADLDAATLTTAYAYYEFTNDNAINDLPNGMLVDYKIGIFYDEGDAANCVVVGENYNNPFDSTNTHIAQWQKDPTTLVWKKYTARDLCGKVFSTP